LFDPGSLDWLVTSSVKRSKSFLQAHLVLRTPKALELVDESAEEEETNSTRTLESDEIVKLAEFFRELTQTEQERVGLREGFRTWSDGVVRSCC